MYAILGHGQLVVLESALQLRSSNGQTLMVNVLRWGEGSDREVDHWVSDAFQTFTGPAVTSHLLLSGLGSSKDRPRTASD